MAAFSRKLWLATVSAILGCAGTAAGQGLLPPPPPANPDPLLQGPGPVITRPGGIAVTPPVTVPPPTPIPVVPGPPPASPFPPPPPPGSAFPAPPPGPVVAPPYGIPTAPYGQKAEPEIFFNWDLEFLFPVASNHLQNTVPTPGGPVNVAIPGADLGFTVAPRLEIGYRLPDNVGQLSFAYRFIASEGTETQTLNGENFDVKSRLNLNEFSFDYTTAAWSPAPRLNLEGWIGGRVDTIFYDTRATNTVANVHESNYFVGAGPHIGGEVNQQLEFGDVCPACISPLFGKVDGAALIGECQQEFSANSPAFEPPRKSLTVETVQVQIGLAYTPPSIERLHFRLGYQFEEWFNLGNLNNSHMNLTTQGGFLGGEFDF